MTNYIRKNQKKLLAIFTAGLMIAFALPTYFGQGGSGRGDYTYGYVGNADLSAKKVQLAVREWEFLSRNVAVKPAESLDPERQQLIPITTSLLGTAVRDQIKQHSEIYALLQEEARQMGVVVTPDYAQSRLVNCIQTDTAQTETEYTSLAMQHLLMVSMAFDRMASAAKFSRNRADHFLSERQNIALNLVEFNASAYDSKVPATFDEKQVQAQFEKYKNAPPEPTNDNHFGFGYKVPNRVKVQYLEVDHEKIKALIAEQLKGPDATKQLIRYYKQHPERYPTTKPVEDKTADLSKPTLPTQPTSMATSGPTSAPAVAASQPASTQPVVLTFQDYRQRVLTDLTDHLTEELDAKIFNQINATMTADYIAYSKAMAIPIGEHPTTLPTTLSAGTSAASLVGPPYGAAEYLTQLALRIQQTHKILPSVQIVGGLSDAKQLGDLPGIGKSSVPPDLTAMQAGIFDSLPFTFAATSLVDPLMTDIERTVAHQHHQPVIDLGQPSPIFNNGVNQFIFRVVEASPAHAPGTLNEARATVVADLRRKQEYELALADARAFLEKMKTASLMTVATQSGHQPIPTSLFPPTGDRQSEPQLPPEYPLNDRVAASEFARQAFALLSSSWRGDPEHPAGLIELNEITPPRVLVAQLAATSPNWPPEQLASYEMAVQGQAISAQREFLRNQWFQFDSIAQRMNYHRPAGAKGNAE